MLASDPPGWPLRARPPAEHPLPARARAEAGQHQGPERRQGREAAGGLQEGAAGGRLAHGHHGAAEGEPADAWQLPPGCRGLARGLATACSTASLRRCAALAPLRRHHPALPPLICIRPHRARAARTAPLLCPDRRGRGRSFASALAARRSTTCWEGAWRPSASPRCTASTARARRSCASRCASQRSAPSRSAAAPARWARGWGPGYWNCCPGRPGRPGHHTLRHHSC